MPPNWIGTVDFVLVTIAPFGETVSHLPNPTMEIMARKEMVPNGHLIGSHLVVVPTPHLVDLIVDGLHPKAIIREDTNRRLLSQTQDRDGVVLPRDSQVNMALDMKSLQVGIIGVNLLDLPPLGGSLHRTTVEEQGTLPTLLPAV